ncbi:MAG: FliH/SctL family protein [bacterium]
MRIIKTEEIENHRAQIIAMSFAEFPEEIPEQEAAETGGNGGAQSAPAQSQIDMEAVQREAASIIQKGKDQAQLAMQQANRDIEQLRAQVQQDAQAMRTQAASEADANKKDAYAAGFSSGEEAGYKKGYEDGYSKGKQTGIQENAAALSMMQQVIEQLKNYHIEILTDSQKDIAKMAMAVAEKVLHKEIMTDPNTVLSVVKNALSKVSFKKQFIVHVNPLDLEVLKSGSDQIRAVLDGYESLKFKASPQVEPGGCIVQTESGSVDARIDRQFAEVHDTVINALDQDEVKA